MIEAAGHYGNGPSLQRRVVGRCVDTARQARDDDIALVSQVGGEKLRHAAPGRRGVAGTYDAHCSLAAQRGTTHHGQQRWWAGDVAQMGRVVRIVDRNKPRADRLGARDLVFSFVETGNSHLLAAAAPGQVGQGVQRRFG